MKELLQTMFKGWAIEANERLKPREAMLKACGGDQLKAELLYLFSHWSNDIEGVAAHYGVGWARRQPDGTLLYADGNIGTLLKGGVLELVEVPEAPSKEHWWYGGEWKEPYNENPVH